MPMTIPLLPWPSISPSRGYMAWTNPTTQVSIGDQARDDEFDRKRTDNYGELEHREAQYRSCAPGALARSSSLDQTEFATMPDA
jgi:hypothetical protein